MSSRSIVGLLFTIVVTVLPAWPQHPPDHMQRRFDPKQSAASFDSPERETWQKPSEAIAALDLKSGQTVADIGAGTGYFTVRLARHDPSLNVIASDIEASMADYIRQRAHKEGLSNVTAVQATKESAGLPSRVDRILIVDTYHHIPNREHFPIQK